MYRIRPTLAASVKKGRDLSGKTLDNQPGMLPIPDGPKRIPARISAITLGCFK
jgi:hypothetical protein